MNRETLRELIPAYALGVLSPDEARQVEALLAEDEAARALLREYQATAAALALIAPARTPSPELEARLLRRARQPHLRPLLYGLAGAAAVLVVIFAALVLSLSTAAPSAEALYDQMMAEAGRVEIALVPALTPDITGTLVYRPGETTAVIRVANLPPLTPEQAYQLWLIDDTGSVSGGIYRLTEATNYIQVPATRPINEYLRFGVSLEPASGSPLGNRASGPRVFSVPIQAA